MSTREREAMDVDAAHPSTSLALVPLDAERGHRAVRPQARPNGAYVFFYGMWYAGVVLIVMGAWFGPRSEEAMFGLWSAGGFSATLGALGILAHVLHRPRMRKLRMGMAAGAVLGLAVASARLVERISREVYATSRIPVLQPLADDLARHGGIRELKVSFNRWVELNGFQGRDEGPEVLLHRRPGEPYSLALEDVLRRDGITRDELASFTARLDAAGTAGVTAGPGILVFTQSGPWRLMYVLPSYPLPPWPMDSPRWRTQPLGDGWYLLATR